MMHTVLEWGGDDCRSLTVCSLGSPAYMLKQKLCRPTRVEGLRCMGGTPTFALVVDSRVVVGKESGTALDFCADLLYNGDEEGIGHHRSLI
jgi:hypothetical protein